MTPMSAEILAGTDRRGVAHSLELLDYWGEKYGEVESPLWVRR